MHYDDSAALSATEEINETLEATSGAGDQNGDPGEADPRDDRVVAFLERVADALVAPYALDEERRVIVRNRARTPSVDVCAPVIVTDFVHSSTSHGSVLRLEMLADDWEIQSYDIPAKDLGSGQPRGVEQLRLAGLYAPASDKEIAALLRSFRPRVQRGADIPTGWHPTRERVFGLRDGRAVAHVERADEDDLPFVRFQLDRDKLEEWKKTVAARASGNPYALFGLALALSGPMLRFLGQNSFGFNLVSPTSRGKSTVARMMATVWPALKLEGWANSKAGLEDVCRHAHESVLLLDEMPGDDLKKVVEEIYFIMNGQPRNVRRQQDQASSDTRPADWRMPVLSTSEKSLTELSAHRSKDLPDGVRVRMIDIAPTTIWKNHHGHGSAYDLLKSLEASLQRAPRVAGPTFALLLAKTPDRMTESAQKTTANFQKYLEKALGVDRKTADGALLRQLEAFTCVAVAGVYAAKSDVLPQSPSDVFSAVTRVAKEWMEPGAQADAAHAEAVERLRNWLAKNATARLVELDQRGAVVGSARVAAGWRSDDSYYLLKDTLQAATGLDGQRTDFLRHLHARGILRKSRQQNSMQVRMGSAVHGRPWVYHIDRLALEQDQGEAE